MQLVVVDVDGTLVNEGRVARVFFKLASACQAIGRRFQHPNRALVARLNEYDKVLVLTSRESKDRGYTSDQLKRAGLKFTEVICAPRKEVLTDWKFDTVAGLQAPEGIIWIDDIFEDSELRARARGAGITEGPPEEFSGGRKGRNVDPFEGL